MKFNLFLRKAIFIFFLISILGCAKENSTNEEVFEPDPAKRARAFADRGGGIFGDINNRKSSGTTFEFASSNVLWRATLKNLDFLPLINADYSGGIIIYDWYSQINNPKEQIKISVQFLSNELRSDSIKITAHKKICDNTDRCTNSTVDQSFANIIKENIIASARVLKIEESKKEKK